MFFKWAHIIKLLKAKERILKMARQPEGTGDLNVMRQAEEHARTFASCPSGFGEHLFMEIFLKGEKTHTTQMKRYKNKIKNNNFFYSIELCQRHFCWFSFLADKNNVAEVFQHETSLPHIVDEKIDDKRETRRY